jgi:transposase
MRVASHYTAAEPRQFNRREQRAPIVRRLQAVLGALESETSKNLVPRVQLSERIIREWVSRYNRQGLDGLEDRVWSKNSAERYLLSRLRVTV